MPDTATSAPASTPPATQADPKATTTNIAKGIQDKANGKAPATPVTPPAGDTTPPADPNAGKEKYTVEGKEYWLTPQERTAWIQKGMAFEPRMDQLARLQQETVQFQRALITDPGKVLTNLSKQANVPIKELVQRVLKGQGSEEVKEVVGQWYYENAVEPSKMTPEQLKAREDAKYRTEREQQDKQAQENALLQQNRQRYQAALGHLKAQIAEAMTESGLPDNNTPLGAEMAWMTAKVMQLADKRQQAMTPKQAIEIVKQHRIRSVQAAYYETLADKDDDGEAITKELGDKIVKKIQKYLLKQVQPQNGKPPTVPNGKTPVRNQRSTINMDDFHDYLEGIKKQG